MGDDTTQLLRLEALLDERRASVGLTSTSLEALVRGVEPPESKAFMERERALRENHALHHKMLRKDAALWGKARAHHVPPELTKQQRKEIRECFQLLDAVRLPPHPLAAQLRFAPCCASDEAIN